MPSVARRQIAKPILTTNMLIINADDFGRNRSATDNTILCFKHARITSASAMVFMADSERAAALAQEHSLDSGLHLNFTLTFNANHASSKLIECQQRIASFLRTNKWCRLLYNPMLKSDFHYVYGAQYQEYVRLYNKTPTQLDGHHHMHLCANMLLGTLIPRGSRVRRNFSFASGEKNILNRVYRRIVDALLTRKYVCTDFFFSLPPLDHTERLQNIVGLANSRDVELMVHPERSEDLDLLMSDKCLQLISTVTKGTYASL